MNRSADVWLLAVASVLATGVAFFLFGFRYPPSVDFPQHVAQLSAWVHFTDPAYGFARQFEVNYRTPYLLSYILARPFVPSMGVLGALKLVILIAALANVGTSALLLRVVGQDPWISLLGFPLTFGFSFYFGFVNFLLATPLVVAAVVLALHYARHLRWQDGFSLAGLLGITFLCHGLAFGVAAIVAFVVSLGESGPSGRRSLRRHWPFLAATLVAVPWLFEFGKTGVPSRHPTQWALGLYRVFFLPGTLVSIGGFDPWATVFGVCVVSTVALSLGRPSMLWHRWALYVVAIEAYLFSPFELLGVAFVYERFAALVIPGMILIAGPAPPLLAARTRRALVVFFSLAWIGVLIMRTRAFNIEAGDFDRAIANLSGGLRLRPVIASTTTKTFPVVPVYLHFPAYYQAAKGGYLGYSFARYSTVLMRYRPGVDVGMEEDAEWNPQLFDAPSEVPRYDRIIVRADLDVGLFLFRATPGRVDLTTHVGSWWIYRTHD